MSAAGAPDRRPVAGLAWLRQFGANARATMATLTRTPRQGGRSIARPSAARLEVLIVAALALIGAAMVLLDARSLALVRRLPSWLVSVAHPITDLGLSGWFLWPLGLALLALAMIDSPGIARFPRAVLAAVAVRLGFVFLAIGLPGLCVTIVKRLIGRARPFVVMVDGVSDPWAYQPFIWRADHASMPSGHATTAFSAAIAIGAVWPRLRLPMWCYAVTIAISRIVVSAHHPSDVIAGGLFGAVGAILVRDWFAARRLAFLVDAEGRVRALPPPSWRHIRAAARRVL